MTKTTTKYARRSDVALRTIGEEAVLVPVHGGGGEDSIYTLNDVGAAIWQLIEPHRDAAEIGRLLAEEFDVSVEKATEDVAAFLALLADKGLIEEA